MEYPPIDRALSWLLLERTASALKAVRATNHNDRLYWTLWNDLAESCQVWIARENVQVEDVDYLRRLVREIEDAENSQPVSGVTGMNVPTYAEVHGHIPYVGVIITITSPAPDMLEQVNAAGDLFILYQKEWIERAMRLMPQEATRQ